MLKQTPYQVARRAREERENPQRLVVYMPQAEMARIELGGSRPARLAGGRGRSSPDQQKL
jgi:hypothetical protein